MNAPPILTPMGTIATTHWRPIPLCLWIGSGGSGLGRRGRLALLRQFFNTNHRNFYTVWGYIMDNASPYGTNQHHTSMTQQSNGVGVRFLCGDDECEAFIWGTKPNFYYFGASEMRWFFTYFGIDGPSFNAWDKTTINKPFSGVYSWCLWCCLAMEGGYEQHGIVFLTEMVTSHTILKTTILAVNDAMLLISGKKTLTQQSTNIGERFLSMEDGDRPIWQPTTWDLFVFSCKIK